MSVSNTTLAIVTLFALIISLASLFSLPGINTPGVGFGTTGEARLNITQSIALNVTQTIIDFGNGTIRSGKTFCEMSSGTDGQFNGTAGDNNQCFNAVPFPTTMGSDGARDGLHIANIGNSAINVSVSTLRVNASDLFFGTPGAIYGTEKYLIRCSGNGTSGLVNYTDISGVIASGTPCMNYLNASASSNIFRLDANITVPDIATGFKNDTLTFTGIKA